ncbi:MAG: hypothetical protein PHX38_09105 [Sulfuricella sp.]|nr:hypothetical protein [Sulfuricella sp.]
MALLLFAPRLLALGLGELGISSKLGEPFSGRIPLVTSPGEPLDPACFRVVAEPAPEDGVPLLRHGIISLESGNGKSFLRITSRDRVNELMLKVLVRVGCQNDLLREYMVLLDMPDASRQMENNVQAGPPQEPAVAKSPAPVPESGAVDWEFMGDEGLAGLAAKIYPHSASMQGKFVRQVVAANPAVFAGRDPAAVLPAGTVVRLPALKKLARSAAPAPIAQTAGVQAAQAAVPVAARASRKKRVAANDEGVRLKLSTGDLDASPVGQVSEGQRAILREKQRLLMDIDDMAAFNLSQGQRLKDLEARIEDLQAKLEGMERQRLNLAAAPGVMAVSSQKAPAPGPAAALAENLAVVAGGGLMLAAVSFWLYRKRRRKAAAEWEEVQGEIPAENEPTLPARVAMPDAAMPASAPPPDAEPAVPDATRTSEDSGAKQHAGQADASSYEVLLRSLTGEDSSISAHSIESTVEEAEIYLALGENEKAIETLLQDIEAHSGANIYPWIKLLDIYRQGGRQQEFETLAQRLNQNFNIVAPIWSGAVDGGSLRSLECFPHLTAKIMSLWGGSECLDYLYHLLRSNRDGKRLGFAPEVIDEILALCTVLEIELGLKPVAPASGVGLAELVPVPPRNGGPAEISPSTGEPPGSPNVVEFSYPEEKTADKTFHPNFDLRSELEKLHPSLIEKIAEQWGKPGCLVYLNKLVGGYLDHRLAFEPAITEELKLLCAMAEMEEHEDIWRFLDAPLRRG